MRAAILICLVSFGCSEAEAPLPTIETPTAETPTAAIRWPSTPDGLPDDAAGCIADYQALADEGLPEQADDQAFSAWYTGPFQTWTTRYNDTRTRCDEVFAAQDSGSAGAQVLLATQSYMHERLGEDAAPFEAEPQMFIMAQYWTLGAACTYQNCGEGRDRGWATFCTTRAEPLPPCPPIQPEAAE